MAQDLNEKLMFIRNNGAERIELVGHCMGAHVAGIAGRSFKQKMVDDIDVIVGINDFKKILEKRLSTKFFCSTQVSIQLVYTSKQI